MPCYTFLVNCMPSLSLLVVFPLLDWAFGLIFLCSVTLKTWKNNSTFPPPYHVNVWIQITSIWMWILKGTNSCFYVKFNMILLSTWIPNAEPKHAPGKISSCYLRSTIPSPDFHIPSLDILKNKIKLGREEYYQV